MKKTARMVGSHKAVLSNFPSLILAVSDGVKVESVSL